VLDLDCLFYSKLRDVKEHPFLCVSLALKLLSYWFYCLILPQSLIVAPVQGYLLVCLEAISAFLLHFWHKSCLHGISFSRALFFVFSMFFSLVLCCLVITFLFSSILCFNDYLFGVPKWLSIICNLLSL
jgi:hypothetical protein